MILILSDIHGNYEALKRVIVDFNLNYRFSTPSKIIILGDIVDYGADSCKTISLLSDISENIPVISICGNHDQYVKTNENNFRTDHARRNFELTYSEVTKNSSIYEKFCNLTSVESQNISINDSREIYTIHGSLSDSLWGDPGILQTPNFKEDNTRLMVSYPKIVLCGHSHIQGFCLNPEDLYFYINPGSVGQPRNGDPRAQYIVCDDNFETFIFRRVDYDIELAAQKIVESGRPKFLATRLFLGI